MQRVAFPAAMRAPGCVPCSRALRRSSVPAAKAPCAPAGRQSLVVRAGPHVAPTVAETKRRFLSTYNRPIGGIYSTIINELLVQQHLIKYNKNFQYDPVFALGFLSVYDQIAEGLPEATRAEVLAAYLAALGEDPAQYRADAEALEAWAKGLSAASDLTPNAEGDAGQQTLAQIAARVSAGDFFYSKFFAIGLFRLLELTGAKDPKALGGLVSALGVRQEAVNRDLMTYKGVLSKLSAAKELAKEYVERERRKAAEREAAKAQEAGKEEPKKEEAGAEAKKEEVPSEAA